MNSSESLLDREREPHVVAELQTLGWRVEGGSAIAAKVFDTAVGPKTAHVYLAIGASNDPNDLLMGDYRSEGRNALEACFVLLPKAATAFDVAQLVRQFAQSVETAVAGTYAARLLLRKTPTDGTYDRSDTDTRQVWWNGICGLELRRDLLPLVRDGHGRPMKLAPWGTFPDLAGAGA